MNKRKVILFISQSLDGFINDRTGGVDWIGGIDESYDSDYGYEDFIQGVDTAIFGRRTYSQIVDDLSPEYWVYDDLESYVLTHEKMEDKTNIHFVSMNVKELIRSLLKKPGRNIWICGGADLINQCVNENLIDEYHITTVPILLGEGIRLFDRGHQPVRLMLESVREENGLITAIYSRPDAF